MNKKRKRSGFSLIEMLVAMAAIAVMMGSITVILYTTLRGAKKAEALGITRTEGAFAMSGMSDFIKYSRGVVSGCNTTNVRIERINRHLVTYSLSGNRIASDGALPNGSTVHVELTSPVVTVQACPGRQIFECPDARSVNICYIVSRAGSTGVDDSASVRFENTVSARNLDN